ncbi:MAG: hypothetical protein JEZ07_16620 [Phycisphaerae bacterium]|nr:hypothetical protein [Phycisphaerae bacterium]
MRIQKSILFSIVVLATIATLPFLLFTGIFLLGNIVDMQFDSDFFMEGLFLTPLLIPTATLIVLAKFKKNTESYKKFSLILLFLNGLILCLGILGIIYFIMNPFSM